MEITFTELREKEVINVLSGKLLGNVCDIVIDLQRNCVLGLIVPNGKSFFNFFKSSSEIFIPMNCICKIGEDVILAEVIESPTKKTKGKVRVFDASMQSDNEPLKEEEKQDKRS